MHTWMKTALCLAFALALAPSAAFAADGAPQSGRGLTDLVAGTLRAEASSQRSAASDIAEFCREAVSQSMGNAASAIADTATEPFRENKLIAYDPADIAAIGNQAQSGHSICCPSYACAYADAVLDGTVHDHDYYTCSNCTWTDWGGGNSSFRSVGGDEQLLREAYDQIASGRPTVIHVSWSGGEHWIALIGYENAIDPDHLTLSNFIALDSWDGSQLNAGSKYVLYGDGCEHISDR